jgi:arsenite oxidase small subunit
MLGPCPLHFSTFDLAKSGMHVMGKAVQYLPQVVLRVDGQGAISATGMYGLIYGYPANLLKLDGGN